MNDQINKNSPKTRGVLVTGASGGIGKAIALRLIAEGYSVICCYNKNSSFIEEIQNAANLNKTKSRFLQFDVSNRIQSQEKLVADIETFGTYYGVICNAGITRDNPFPAITGEDWDAVLRTNLDSFYNILQPLVMPMIHTKKAGRIITISSVSGLVGNRGQTHYSASKAGLIGATKSLAIELGKRNITVNCVVPGVIETEMVPEHVIAHVKPLIALKRLGKPEDVASVVAFLLSDDAAYITKQAICVDGGMI